MTRLGSSSTTGTDDPPFVLRVKCTNEVAVLAVDGQKARGDTVASARQPAEVIIEQMQRNVPREIGELRSSSLFDMSPAVTEVVAHQILLGAILHVQAPESR